MNDLELPPMRPMPAGRQQWHRQVVMAGIGAPRLWLVPLYVGIAAGVVVSLLAGGAVVAHLYGASGQPLPLSAATASRAPTGSPASGTTALGPPCLPATPFASVSGPLDSVLTASGTAPVQLGVRFATDHTIRVSTATVGVYPTATEPQGSPVTAPPTTQPGPRAPVAALQQAMLTDLVPSGPGAHALVQRVTPAAQQLPPGVYSAWITVTMAYRDCRTHQKQSVQLQARLAEVRLK